MKKKFIIIFGLMLAFVAFVSLTQKTNDSYDSAANMALINANYTSYTAEEYKTDKSYKDRVFYEIFVRSFNDSNKDSIGDLKGITSKLDYLKSLGISGIWLMPINESSTYHGYDVTNYYKINPDYGTMEDFHELVNEAHKRDIAVVMDLVINHSSSKNPWFLEAVNNKESKYRNYYTWSDSESGKAVKSPTSIGSYPWRNSKSGKYYALFDQIMPDLNYDNDDVRAEVKKIAKYYLELGVDGFRLDAARHVYDGELAKNLQWWTEFNDYVKSVNKNALLIGEVWDESTVVADYLTSLDTSFNFDLSTAILTSVNHGNLNSLGTIINDIHKVYEAKNKNYLDSTFLSNHDQNRVMSTLKNIDKCKTAAAILLTLPGTPYIYYGEETGLPGAKPDENIREPFIWDNKDSSKNCSWKMPSSKKDVVAVNVQEQDPNSLLNFYKTFINLRTSNPVLTQGSFEVLQQSDKNIFAFKRALENEEIYVFINGSSDTKNASAPSINAEVLYSSSGNTGDMSINGGIELKGSGILVVKKK